VYWMGWQQNQKSGISERWKLEREMGRFKTDAINNWFIKFNLNI